MSVTMESIKKLREATGAGVMDVKKALGESKGDMKKAKEWIKKKGLAKAEKKAERETKQGIVYAYVHHDGKSGALVSLLCETDFVARTEDFVNLAKEIAMQVTSMNPINVDELLEQPYMRDTKKTIQDLVKAATAKLGENIKVSSFERKSLD